MHITQEIRCQLELLGFKEEQIPGVKEIRKSFIQLSKQLHPDKNTSLSEEDKRNAEERFKNILVAYTSLLKTLLENENDEDSEEEDVEEEDEEEDEEIMYEFKEMNSVTVNMTSVTIRVPTKHVDQWEIILSRNYGDPIHRSNKNNGKQYHTEN